MGSYNKSNPASNLTPGPNPFAGNLTLAERHDARGWHFQATPNPADATGSDLWTVSCATPTDCMAIGNYLVGGTFQPLAEHWDGARWKIAPVARPAGSFAMLDGVSCPAARDCTAVGQLAKPDYLPLAEHWNGATWKLERTASPPSAAFHVFPIGFSAVSCPTARDCVAVGYYELPSPEYRREAFAEHSNGSEWRITATPLPLGAYDGALNGVSCATERDCTAVGYYEAAAPPDYSRTLADHWNGSTWQVETTPSHARAESYLQGVSCATAIGCTAVGLYVLGANIYAIGPLVERWDGISWETQQTPSSRATFSGYESVSCPTVRICVAVGAAGSAINRLQGSILGEQVDVSPVRGTVFYAPPSTTGTHFVPLTRERRIPVGSQLDTVHGTVSITSAVNFTGGTRTGEFYGGQFEVLQKRVVGAVTKLQLTGKLDCSGVPHGAGYRATAARHRPHRRLWGNDNGSGYSTGGGYGSGTTQGTKWLTDDSCTGTRFTVVQGTVKVTDFVRHITVLVTAGHSYLAGH